MSATGHTSSPVRLSEIPDRWLFAVSREVEDVSEADLPTQRVIPPAYVHGGGSNSPVSTRNTDADQLHAHAAEADLRFRGRDR